MDSKSASAWRSLICPSFSGSASATCAFLSGGFFDLSSPPAPFTSPADFLESPGVGEGVPFSSSPSPGDGEGVSFCPSPGLGDSSPRRSPGDGEDCWPCCLSAPGAGEGVSPGGCCCCFCCGSFFAWAWLFFSCCWSFWSLLCDC